MMVEILISFCFVHRKAVSGSFVCCKSASWMKSAYPQKYREAAHHKTCGLFPLDGAGGLRGQVV